MHTGLKISAFAAALAATFGAAYGTGNAVDPVTAEKRPARHDGGHASGAGEEGEGGTKGGGHDGHAQDGEAASGGADVPGGLQVSEGGYRLDLKTPRLTAKKRAELRFTVVREGTGSTVTAYRREHGKELHLIVASRDLTVYRHLHPARAADGTWSIPVRLPEAGGYRVFADFRPQGAKEGLTLGSDLAVSGAHEPAPLPRERATASVEGGYEVTLDGALRPGKPSALTLNVSRNGKPVRDLQPYLGAYGHLVALRSGDLAYLHVHPNGEPGDGRTRPGPGVSFTATAPSEGAYRLFLDFRHEGKVRTAAFTVHTDGASDAPDGPAADEHADKNADETAGESGGADAGGNAGAGHGH